MPRRIWITAVGLLVGSGLLSAQSATGFGVDTASTQVITAWEMDTGESITATGRVGNFQRYLKSPDLLIGTAHLPAGAEILFFEIEACDNSPTGGASMLLVRSSGATTDTVGIINTGEEEMPGCQYFASNLLIPVTVNNVDNRYLVLGGNAPYDGSVSLGAVRIFYRLQVSPAPGFATFNDVPTSDPAFQFIQALVSSGVTAGCGGGNYCPDAAVTRRQMAVFLAKLLGLQWSEDRVVLRGE